MIAAYEEITRKGVGMLNEDAILSHPEAHLYGVLDGVSSLVPYLNAKQETGGFIAANLVKTYFESLSDIGSLADHAAEANDLLREQMALANIDMKKKEALWGTALAIVRIREDGVEFLQTGDCMILAVYDNEEVRPLTWRQVAHLEAPAFAKWEEGVANGLNSRIALHDIVIETITNNRYRSNTDGGYGVLNGERDAVRYFEYGRINRTCLKRIILLTDGMFWPSTLVPESSSYWSVVARRILHEGVERYTEALIELEESDPECVSYTRFKKSDDKTAVVLSINA